MKLMHIDHSMPLDPLLLSKLVYMTGSSLA
jgi:hypothetical protein